MRLSAFSLLAVVLLTACVPDGVLRHDMHVMPDYGWRRRDTVTFAVDSVGCEARLWLCVRADAAFDYDTLWLRFGCDTVAVPAGALRGKWLRQCEWPLGQARPGRFDVTHIMRRDPLPGIRELGVKITKRESTQAETP